MKRSKLILAVLWGLGAVAVCAAVNAENAPATQPALPEGHPAIETNQPAAPSGSLPAGHPDISQMQPRQLPGAAGAATSGGMSLPAGHPDLSAMRRPSTQPAATLGTLTIKAEQGTAGGPAIGEDPLVIEVYVSGEMLDRVEAKLGDDGKAQLGGIPLRLGAQAIVKVTHAGVEYQAVSPVMSPTNANVELTVPVFETTDVKPDWRIKMRHVMLQPAEGGVNVIDMLAVENPSDRAWKGSGETFKLALPASAQKIQLAGAFHECCAKIEGSTITNTMALLPGANEYRVMYYLPAASGNVDLTVDSPAASSAVMVMLPDDGAAVTAQGLELSGSVDMGKGRTRFYKAAEVAAGAPLKLSVSGFAVAPVTASSAATGASAHVAQIVAGSGALVIVLLGVAFLFLKSAPKKALR